MMNETEQDEMTAQLQDVSGGMVTEQQEQAEHRVLPPAEEMPAETPSEPEAAPDAEEPESPAAAAVPSVEENPPAAEEEAPVEDKAAQESRQAAVDAYWKTALTGNPDSIPESFYARDAAADVTSSAEETEYDLLNAVNRSWYADHSDLSRERILADWPRLRTELADRLGVGDSEQEVFTALSQQQEDKELREEAEKVCKDAYLGAFLGTGKAKPEESSAPESRWAELERKAREQGEKDRRELLPSAKTLSSLFSIYYGMENSLPGQIYSCMWDTPEIVELYRGMVDMPPERRQLLYDLTLREMDKAGKRPPMSDDLMTTFRRSFFRGGLNFDAGLAQFSGNVSAAMAHGVAQLGLERIGATSDRMDDYLRLLDELRVVAQERVNPIHQKDEPWDRMLVADIGEALPTAVISSVGWPGMALAAPSGIGMGIAEARSRAEQGDISLQTAAGVLSFGAQTAISEMFARGGAKMFEHSLGRFVSGRLAGASGSFTLKALRGGETVAQQTARNLVDNSIGRTTDMLAQEGAARLEGVASNIDWEDYGSEWSSIELGIREAARSLPYVLIGSGRASLHHFRDPHAIVADGAALTRWGVPEDVQRRLLQEDNPRKQNRLLYDALHNGSRWGGVGFLEDAARSLRLLHTDDFQPFRDKDVVRDFLQLPAETEAERARVLTLGNPSDPVYIQEMVRKHAGGSEITDPKKAMPFLLMTEAWTQRAYPEGLESYPTLRELAPLELTKIGNEGPAAEKARSAAIETTVRYLDALTYRLLLNSTSYGTLVFSGRKPAEVGAETDALRHRLIDKTAEAVLARAGGASQESADQIYGQFITDYYGRMRFNSSADSWIRFAPPGHLAALHTKALSERALRRGLSLPATKYPELLRSYWVVQGVRNCVQALVSLLPHQSDFRTALSRGMTPQEAYAHLLHRELGSRLSGDGSWFPGQLVEDITDRPAMQVKNREMTELYTRITGNAPESREGDDGRTYWRILKPDKHYTRWHDSLENCLNDMAADSRVRFLPLGGDMLREMAAAHDEQGRYDAARVGMEAPWGYSYYDRLSAAATGDMIRFWQEDATRAVPGASVELYRYRTGPAETELHPWLREHPDYPGAWQIDARGVRTPLGLLRGRFDAYWRNRLNSGWLSAEDAMDFLMRRGEIDEPRRQEIESVGSTITNNARMKVTPELFFSGKYHGQPEPQYDTVGMNGLLARHLADYTTAYFMAHLKDMPMPDSAREWFGLTPFRLDYELFHEDGSRIQFGKNNTEQSEKWAHQRTSQLMGAEMDHAERILADESGEHPLGADPLYPLLMAAIYPEPGRRAEQGWAYTLGGANALMSIRPESWNLLQEPVRAWRMMSEREKLRLSGLLGDEAYVPEGQERPVPKDLLELDAVLSQYPELHRYALHPEDLSRIVQMDIPETRVVGYRRFDSAFDHPSHEGSNIVHAGFLLREGAELPEFFRSDERVMHALETLSTLRRSVHQAPYADANGVWWKGVRYGGKEGKRLLGMDSSWKATEPMANIRRLFREMPEDGSPVMDFAKGISFRRRAELPEHAFMSTTVYRSPNYPLTQVRLMPGEREASFPYARSPYVTHSFIGAPMADGLLIRNDGEHNFFLTPLEDFRGDVTREMIGHMAGWWGKESVKSALAELMDRTQSPERLAMSNSFPLTNREVLMQLTEDSRFSASLEGRAPHELSAEEALAATWFHTLAEYETGVDTEQAGNDLLRIHEYFTEHPEHLEAVERMLNDHRVWYELDPNDKWYHVVTGSREIRRANQVKREIEEIEWKKRMREYIKMEDEWERLDLNNRIGKPKKHRKE